MGDDAYREGWSDTKHDSDESREVRAYLHVPCGSVAAAEFFDAGGGCWNCETNPGDGWTPLYAEVTVGDRVVFCGDTGRHLPCPVCKGAKSHHAACSVPVLGLYERDRGAS